MVTITSARGQTVDLVWEVIEGSEMSSQLIKIKPLGGNWLSGANKTYSKSPSAEVHIFKTCQISVIHSKEFVMLKNY